MPIGLPVALALAAQAAPAAATEKSAEPAHVEDCGPARPDPNTREIVICAERPTGYRIDPDIMTMKRMKKSGGRPVRPGIDGTRDRTVCAVGPQGCQIQGVNLLAAAGTAVEMAKRLSEGKEIGSMFVTDPQIDDYQMYAAAKRAREAQELEAKANAITKAAKTAN